MKELFLQASDKYQLCLHIFDVKNPKAVVQIAHGMEEHQERYVHFAEFLNANGYAVVSADLRGHGKYAKTLGYFKKKDGYKALILDQIKITNWIKQTYEGLPIFLFAHSMSSMISRIVLQTRSNLYDKVILSSPPCYAQASKIGLRFANIISMFNGEKFKSKKIQEMSYRVFNKKIKNPKTDFDWICKNKKTIENYIADPYCGFGFTSSGYSDLFKLNILMNEDESFKNVKTQLPILIVWGENDPCVGGKKGIKESALVLAKAGFQNIKQIVYSNMRHELVNEENYQIVFDDILEFLKK